MPRVLIRKSNGRLIMSQGLDTGGLQSLIQNGLNSGFTIDQIEAKHVTKAELAVIKQNSKTQGELDEEVRCSEVEVEQGNSGLKKKTVSQANTFINNQINRMSLVDADKDILKTLFKKVAVFLIR